MAEKKNIEKRNITVFGEETEFDGVLEFRDNLIIEGKFKGTITAPTGDLQISKKSVCEFNAMEINSVVISGDVSGKLIAKERVEICSGSVVKSDIQTSRFRIANNVDYSGQVSMLEEEPNVDLFEVASSEYKQAMVVHTDVIK
ncbi:MAG: polymer-forming cytoskeletal protein [Treponema sp.]|nr:polymer-forming cytoskeletal protein [Treponema sp.]